MKAITLHQPWASLIAEGRKKFETRSWPPPEKLIGERIAIHAGKQVHWELVYKWFGEGTKDLPAGAVICTAVIIRAFQIANKKIVNIKGPPVSPRTRPPLDDYGDYSPGRWVWQLGKVAALAEPVRARGQQKFWAWQPQLGLAAQSQDDLKNGLCPHQPLQTADSVGWEINYYTPKASLITLFHKVPHRAG